MAKKLPFVAVAFIIGGFTSMGMPGFSGFAAELPIFLGVWNAKTIGDVSAYPAWFANLIQQLWYYPLLAAISAISIVVTAAYILRAVQRVFFGKLPAHFDDEAHEAHAAPSAHAHEPIRDITALDRIAIVILCSLMIIVGVYPAIMSNLINSGVTPILNLLGVQ
jgi:NADH-quinone oxidoreductase subunit M